MPNKVDELAEEPWKFLEKWLHMIFVDAFKHGYKHAKKEGGRNNMDNECEFNHEGFCILQNEYPKMDRCPHAEGDLQICRATKEDLIEICPDCDQPIEECECGTNWVLVFTKDGKIMPIISKEYYEKVNP